MRKIKTGIIGIGYIGVSHLEAIRRIGFAEIVAAADTNEEIAKKRAEDYYIPNHCTLEQMLADPEIDAIHNCTPNNLHFLVNSKIIEAGKHVFSEKPLGINSIESAEMLKLLAQKPDIVHGVNFNYRMNPLVQEMKNRILQGAIGKPMLVHGSYLQDWLLYDTDYNWRIEPEHGGPSRSIADIGSHWMDLAQTVLNSRITAVCADLVTLLPIRKKPVAQLETTFSSNININYTETEIKTEDYGAVLFRMENGISGVFHVSQMSAGRKCRFDIEVNGSLASFYWNQEEADKMWMGKRDDHNMTVMRCPKLISDDAKGYTYLAAGHPEGWNDALKNNIFAFYKWIAEGKKIGTEKPDFATFDDGHYIMLLIEAILQSSKEKKWVEIGI